MPDYSITLDIPDVAADIDAQVIPRIAQAIRAIAQEAQLNLIEAVKSAKIWSGEKTPYINSIKVRYLTELSAEVVSDYKYASEIETGRPGRDMKRILATSPKVRRTESGKRFLIVPIRASSPNNAAHAAAMPSGVYALASQLRMSSITNTGTRPSGEVTERTPGRGMHAAAAQTPFRSSLQTRAHEMVNRNSYAWGGRLSRSELANESKETQRRYGGMVRMKESTGGSTYVLFRTMQEGQSGWVTRPQPGLYLARDVAEYLRPIAEEAINKAVGS
ncbi:hypothetical protein GCM10027093_09470 [Paraburkholderia jirisanensis]